MQVGGKNFRIASLAIYHPPWPKRWNRPWFSYLCLKVPEDDASDEEETKPSVHGNTEKSTKSGDGLENISQNAKKDVKSKVIIKLK